MDVFHDTVQSLKQAAVKDAKVLQQNGYTLDWNENQEMLQRTTVSKAVRSTKVEWAYFLRNTFDLKISPCPVAKLITETAQLAGEFVIINILGKFPGAQQFIILEGFPAIFNRVEGRVENNTVRVQMGIKRAGRIVGK